MTAANEHFSRYGYEKTTVADLAKQVGYSKAYIYRFFESKHAIGETICSQCLKGIVADVNSAVAATQSATEAFRVLVKTLVTNSQNFFFSDRKLYDIAAHSASERWDSYQHYETTIAGVVREVLLRGRESGEFERKTPLDETVRAIMQVIQPFMNPVMLQYNLNAVPDASGEVVSLVLRSLSP